MEIKLRDKSEGPIYLQVREQLESKISGNELKAGAELPSPAGLARQLAVDKGEIERAYFELEHAGMVLKSKVRDFLGKEKITYVVK